MSRSSSKAVRLSKSQGFRKRPSSQQMQLEFAAGDPDLDDKPAVILEFALGIRITPRTAIGARGANNCALLDYRLPLRDRKFADSPLEGTGFEPSVPRERLVLSFSFTPTFPLARVNRPDPISESILRPCGQGARPCRHHRRDHPNGLLHQQWSWPSTTSRPGRRKWRAEGRTLAIAGAPLR
jgi:hypothetical protein